MLEASKRQISPIMQSNKQQKDFLTLMMVRVQALFDAGHLQGAQAGQPDSGSEMPSLRSMRVFLGGPGGAGKSECIDMNGVRVPSSSGWGPLALACVQVYFLQGLRCWSGGSV